MTIRAGCVMRNKLAKVGEDLGKPILFYTAPYEKKHSFYVLDENVVYGYIMKPEETVKNATTRPTRGTQIESKPGEKIGSDCPACDTAGNTLIKKQPQKTRWSRFFSSKEKKQKGFEQPAHDQKHTPEEKP